MSVHGYAMNRAPTDAPRRPFISFVGTTVFATIPSRPMPKIRPILPKTSISDRRGGGKNAFFVEKKRVNQSGNRCNALRISIEKYLKKNTLWMLR